MIVPQYWAEEKSKSIINGKQVTIKRFGWSDESESDAKIHAKNRLDEAVSRMQSGEQLRKIDHKVPYNGAEGLPIREEIISRHQDSLITRNSYGALCLNTPDVLFADIDFKNEPGFKLNAICFIILSSVALFSGVYCDSTPYIFLGLILAVILTTTLASLIFKLSNFIKGGSNNIALNSIRKFSENNPEWHLRVYKTPNGYRLLVMHQTFDPKSEETHEFFRQINTDPIYMLMCKNQNCFRARVSPKPWRIGMDRLKPRPGVWPINPERLTERAKWVEKYKELSLEYASCRFVEELGSHIIDSKAKYIMFLHDELCQSNRDIEIA